MRAATACRGFFATTLVQASAGEQQPAVHRVASGQGSPAPADWLHATEEILPPADNYGRSGFRLAVQTENPHGIIASWHHAANPQPLNPDSGIVWRGNHGGCVETPPSPSVESAAALAWSPSPS